MSFWTVPNRFNTSNTPSSSREGSYRTPSCEHCSRHWRQSLRICCCRVPIHSCSIDFMNVSRGVSFKARSFTAVSSSSTACTSHSKSIQKSTGVRLSLQAASAWLSFGIFCYGWECGGTWTLNHTRMDCCTGMYTIDVNKLGRSCGSSARRLAATKWRREVTLDAERLRVDEVGVWKYPWWWVEPTEEAIDHVMQWSVPWNSSVEAGFI